jgi:shikimate dehydrogenase
MGRTAWPTRILAALLGSPYIYGSLGAADETAPGQPPIELLAGLLRARELSGSTTVFGLLGNPALQSLGHWLHNRVFRRLGLDAIYLPFESSRPEAVLQMLPRRQLRGLSVTAPWKGTMVQQCHRLSPEAQATSVVNTIVFEAHGMLVGHNTDVEGVRLALVGHGVSDQADGRQTGVVIGTGGAARAAAYALRQMGYAVTMLGRSLEPARPFAAHHGVRMGALSQDVLAELRPAVVVHATPVGGIGRNPDERLLPSWRPEPGTVVLDMVYQPSRTRLLADVAAAGGVAIPGTEMFLLQAAAQVRLFTGHQVPVADLRLMLAGSAVTAA